MRDLQTPEIAAGKSAMEIIFGPAGKTTLSRNTPGIGIAIGTVAPIIGGTGTVAISSTAPGLSSTSVSIRGGRIGTTRPVPMLTDIRTIMIRAITSKALTIRRLLRQ